MVAQLQGSERRGGYSLRRQMSERSGSLSVEAGDRPQMGREESGRAAPGGDGSDSMTPGLHEWIGLLRNPHLERTVERVGAITASTDDVSAEETARRLRVIEEAQAGDPEAKRELKAMILQCLRDERLTVPDVAEERVAEAVFQVLFGLGVLTPVYEDPTVDEIRVNGPHKVYTVRRGVTHHEPLQFRDARELQKVLERSLFHDRISLTRDNPRVETTRRDGARVTAVIPPISPFPVLVIRKFDTMPLTEDAYLASGSFNERILALLKALAYGRASLLISGATGTGKSHLLRLLATFQPHWVRTVVLETDHELYLERYLPDRDIVPLEAHPELNPPVTLEALFSTVLRLSPDVIILGEARAGEALEMIKAAGRGHKGSMGTVHVSSVSDCVESMCQMVLEQYPTRPVDVLRAQVASGYHVVIQVVRWPSGRRMIQEITEIGWDPIQKQVTFNPLVLWQGSEDSPELGDWTFPNQATARLVRHLQEGGVSMAQLREVGLV